MSAIIARVQARVARIHAGLSNAQPPAMLAGYMLFAILLFLASNALSLGEISVDNGRWTKGFYWELNWGPNHLVAIPVALFCSALLLRNVRNHARQLADARMVVNDEFRPLRSDGVLKSWEGYQVGPGWFAILAAIAFGASYAEWAIGSAWPLIHLDPEHPPPVDRAYGWTTGALLAPDKINRWANLVLTFVAFTAQGFVVTVFALAFANVLAFCRWVYSFAGPEFPRLIPSLRSKDTRLGFEVFEPFVFRVLYVGLGFTFVLFLIRVQSVYNAADRTAKTPMEFVFEDVIKGFMTSVAKVFKGEQPELFDLGGATNYSSAITLAGMSAMVTVIIVVPSLILSVLARESREALRECLKNPPCPPCKGGAGKVAGCKQQLDDMDFWPLRYPRPMGLVTYIVFAGVCFLFYKLTFVLIGAVAIKMVQVVYRGVTSPPRPSKRGSSGGRSGS